MSFTKTRPLSDAVREKLAKLLPMLSSTHMGERAGAAAAIGRVFEANGLGWHDLTAAVTTPPPPEPARPSRRYDAEDGSITVSAEKLIAVIEMLRACRKYNAASEEFLSSMMDRAICYAEVFVSAKQKAWFEDLHRQCQRGRT
jgi:hypothetical protein